MRREDYNTVEEFRVAFCAEFQDLPDDQKTRELCTRAYRFGVDMHHFPKSLMTTEFILQVLQDTYQGSMCGPYWETIPEEYINPQVIDKLIKLNGENIAYISYENQTADMVKIACENNAFAIEDCNPLLIDSDMITNAMSDSNYDIYCKHYATKYDELVSMITKRLKTPRDNIVELQKTIEQCEKQVQEFIDIVHDQIESQL